MILMWGVMQALLEPLPARIASQFYWPEMKHTISAHVKQCAICQQAKHTTALPTGLLSPLPIPSQVWEDVAMGFITGFSNSCGFTVILVVVDGLTEYGHFFPLKSDYDSKVVAEVFIKNIVKLHGLPLLDQWLMWIPLMKQLSPMCRLSTLS
jgi:hypothetical protein